ncbi:MAG: DegT/DnrJ/EryC1/StrS family aminotransferase [Spirochaetes bacterium]|nr:DegT/DnrJ/EryC1/StrS family aminotransferase [Spirochaetota bacterium]
MDTVLGCLVTDSVGPGEYTRRFTKAAREALKFEAAAAMRSPYLALVAALRRLGLKAGSSVAISPLAPLYHKLALEDSGFQIQYYDHDPDTCEADLIEIGSKGCSAIILYEPFGLLPDKGLILSLGLLLIEDISQALGASRDGAAAGTFGNLALYGLEQGALVTAGGGALLLAASRREASIVRELSETMPREFALTDYNAALGLAQLKDLPESIERRGGLEASFRTELAKTRHRALVQKGEGQDGLFVFPVLLESGMRDVVIHAKKNGIEAAPAFEQSIVSMEDFPSICPGAHALALRCIIFPLHEKIGVQDARLIEKVLATLP